MVESYYQKEFGPRPSPVPLLSVAKERGVPTPLVRQASKEVQEKTGIDVLKISRAHGRARRARWAITTAATLAAVDGPLPIGDAIAIGVLGAYAGYEAGMAIKDVAEGVGY